MHLRIFAFSLVFLITMCGCQTVDKQTANRNEQANDSLPAENITVGENEEGICIPGDAQNYLSKKELNNPGLLLNKDLEPIYEKYKDTLNDELLQGLAPIDILRLRNKAVEEENLEVETNLIILPPEIKREDFLKKLQSNEVSRQNGRLRLEKYKQFKGKVIEITVDENKAYVVIQGDGFCRFEKTEDGVWKLGWLQGNS